MRPTERHQPSTLRPRRVGVCGSSRLSPHLGPFARRLGRALAGEPGLVIVTGGFLRHEEAASTVSADWSAVQGALARLRADGGDPQAAVETLHPGDDGPGFRRFEAGRTVLLRDRSPQARRFALVYAVDALLAVEGRHATGEMIDVALAFGKPCLPIPCTAGQSRERWNRHRGEICAAFEIDAATAAALEAGPAAWDREDDVDRLAGLVRTLVLRRLRRKCFVIMPFDPGFRPLYDGVIGPAVSACGLTPLRADALNLVGDAVEVLRAAIHACDCAVAVLTGFNPNVLYEVGLAHALGKEMILLCELAPGSPHLPELPFDLRTQYVLGYRADRPDELRTRLDALLAEHRPR